MLTWLEPLIKWIGLVREPQVTSKKISISPSTLSEKAMETHSSTLAWKIPWPEEPGRLQSWGRRVGHNWATSLSLFTFMHWRRKWQPTAVFLPGESQGRRSLICCRLWGHNRVGHDWSDLAAAAAMQVLNTSTKKGTGGALLWLWDHCLVIN